MWDLLSNVTSTVSSFLGGDQEAAAAPASETQTESSGGGFWGGVGAGVSGVLDQVGSWFSSDEQEDAGPVSVPFTPMTDDEYEAQEANKSKLRAIDQREAEWQALYEQGKVHPADGAEWRAQWNNKHGMP